MPYAFAPSLGLALLASMRGEYGPAEELLSQEIQRSEKHSHHLNETMAHYILAGIDLAQGQYGAAQRHARAAAAAAQVLGDRWFLAYCFNRLGKVAAARGDYATATAHYQASYAIREGFDDDEGMALALHHLGEAALAQEDIIQAQHLLQESLAIYRGIDDKGGLASALHGLGRTALACGDLEAARQMLHRALQSAGAIHFEPLILEIVVSAAHLLLKSGPPETAASWLAFVQQHPIADHQLATRAQELGHCFDVEAAPRAEQAQTLATVVAHVQARLLPEAQQQLEPAEEKRAAAPLVEPLTEREREVLQLLAQGFTNKEIADELTIALGTVKAHNHHIYGKLSVDNRVEAVTGAQDLGLI